MESLSQQTLKIKVFVNMKKKKEKQVESKVSLKCITFLGQIIHTVGYSSSLALGIQDGKSSIIIHKKVIWNKN